MILNSLEVILDSVEVPETSSQVLRMCVGLVLFEFQQVVIWDMQVWSKEQDPDLYHFPHPEMVTRNNKCDYEISERRLWRRLKVINSFIFSKYRRYETVTQHIPTMTDSHHGGFLSVMIMVGICQVTKSHHKWWLRNLLGTIPTKMATTQAQKWLWTICCCYWQCVVCD